MAELFFCLHPVTADFVAPHVPQCTRYDWSVDYLRRLNCQVLGTYVRFIIVLFSGVTLVYILWFGGCNWTLKSFHLRYNYWNPSGSSSKIEYLFIHHTIMRCWDSELFGQHISCQPKQFSVQPTSKVKWGTDLEAMSIIVQRIVSSFEPWKIIFLAGFEPSWNIKVGITAVSYTHLTLPTICSV